MAVFGFPEGAKGYYQQWKEDNVVSQVVFAIVLPGNTQA